MKVDSLRRVWIPLLIAGITAALFAAPAGASVLESPKLLPDGREGAIPAPGNEKSTVIPGHYIVVFEDSVDHPGNLAETQTEQRDGELGFVYRHALKGYSAELSKDAVKALRSDPRVKYVSPQHKVEAFSQTIPTGISRIAATANASLDIDGVDDVRVNADVAVIDTGIDYEHPDLDVFKRTNCVPPGKFEEPEAEECIDGTGIDDHGHGTHVAGTIGALDNGEGVVGVAPGVRLWAVKVMTGGGSGTDAWIIAGIDWVTAHASEIEVANMSLGCDCQIPAWDDAIKASVEAGVVYAVAAGNSGADASTHSPASSPDVIAVSALADTDGEAGGSGQEYCPGTTYQVNEDGLADFSNWGSAVEIAAPGVCILSTFPEGEYGAMSGTSMASPHVAGAAAVLASKSNPNSKGDVEAIRQALVDSGSLNWTDKSDWYQDRPTDTSPEPLLYLGDAALPTEVATGRAEKIGIEGATLSGAVQARGISTTYKFEYGKTTSYGSSTSSTALPGGSKYAKVSKAISGLAVGTTYHYRLVAENEKGVFKGKDETFVPTRWSVKAMSNTFKDVPESVSCASATACIAVGWEFVEDPYDPEDPLGAGFGHEFPLAFQWNGSEWKKLSAAVPPSEEVQNNSLNDVSCPSANACAAVGTAFQENVGERPLVELWDGAKWTISWPLIPEDAELSKWGYVRVYLNAISCTSAMSCVAVGWYDSESGNKTLIQNWDGSEWKIVSSPNPEQTEPVLRDISCISATSCVAVGFTDEGGDDTLIMRSTGGVWSLQSSPNVPEVGNRLTGVSCTSASACVAVGRTTKSEELKGLGAIWNGSEWTLNSPGGEWVESVSCMAANGCLMVGAVLDGENPIGAYAERWNGSTWTPDATILPDDAVPGGAGFFDVSCQSGACMGVGWYRSGSSRPLAEQRTLPTAVTDPASGIQSKAATLKGSVNPNGSAATFQFEYGTTTAYGTKAPAAPASAGSGVKAVSASQNISGLKAGTTYHFRILANTEMGTLYGQDRTFTTAALPPPTYGFAVGSQGTANGQLEAPLGIAFDSAGNLLVADFFNNRIQKFNSKGEYLTKFGTSGTGNGQFELPTDLAIDASGNIWVLDRENNRIQKFNSKGEYVSKFGSKGTGNGQFENASALAIDSSGNIWVVDRGNNRVQKFNSSGTYQSKFGSKGTGNGQFETPQDIAIDASGNLWISDAGNNRVQKFNSSGGYLSKLGSKGTGNGQFEGPMGLSFDSEGNLWAVDRGNGRVQAFNPSGEYLTKFGAKGTGEGQMQGPWGLAFDSKGNLWVGDDANSRVQKWLFTLPQLPPTFSIEVGSQGSGNGQLSSPDGGLAFDSEGNLWVVDSGNHRVQKFNSKGEYVSKFGSSGSGNGQFDDPSDIAIDTAGNLWIVDSDNNRIQRFNSKGEYQSQFGTKGSGNGQLSDPLGLAIDASGNLWVVDKGNDRVQKFNSAGTYQSQFGTKGTGNGQFDHPQDIAVDPAGNLWVVDAYNHRVQKFNSKGEYLSKFGSKGPGNGQLEYPRALAFGPEGNIWVTDRFNTRVEAFNSKGEYVSQFGSPGSGNGQFGSLVLGYLAFDAGGNVWVGDTGNHRLQKWLLF